MAEMTFIWKSAIESAMNAIAFADLEGRLTYINSSFLKMWGYDENREILGRPAVEFWDVKKDADMVIQKVCNEGSWQGELTARKKDGSVFHVQLYANMVHDEKGTPLCMMASFEDITERVSSKEDLQKVATGVYDAVGEKFFYYIVRHLAETLDADYAYVAELLKDKTGRVKTLAMLADGMIMENIEVDLKGTPCERVYEDGFCAYKEGITESFPDAQTMHGMGVEGYAGILLSSASGEKLGIMSVMYRSPVEDLEKAESMLKIFASRAAAEIERRHYEQKLIKARNEIEIFNNELEKRVRQKKDELVKSQETLIQSEKLAAMGKLAGGLAHELNSPLAGLMPMIEKFRDGTEKDSREYYELSLMLKACSHMALIVKNFNDFSRQSSGSFTLIQLNQLIEDTLSFSAVKLRHRGINIQKYYDEQLPYIKGEPADLQQVVLNIIQNAFDAMPEGGDFEIKTGTSSDRDIATLEFTDTGTGIEKEEIRKIFDPFFTTKKPGEGTGLGLSISYSIIKKHGGEITAESVNGKGARFRIVLPAYQHKRKKYEAQDINSR